MEGEGAGSTWSSGRQMSIREWDIPYEELKIGDKIGIGRFSTVFAGNWHGDVAIKFLDMENLDDENTLEAFRLDVATFRYGMRFDLSEEFKSIVELVNSC